MSRVQLLDHSIYPFIYAIMSWCLFLGGRANESRHTPPCRHQLVGVRDPDTPPGRLPVRLPLDASTAVAGFQRSIEQRMAPHGRIALC